MTVVKKEVIQEKEEEIIDPIKRIRFFKIKRIQDIITFFNIIQTRKLTNTTDLTQTLTGILSGDIFQNCDLEIKEEYVYKLKENTILLVGNKFFPMKFDFIDEDASDILLKFVECLIVACRLSDLAEERGKFKDENKKFYLGSFMGGIIDFIHRVDVINNKLISSSTDETHLLKNCMEIYSSGSKLISLEESLIGEEKKINIQNALDIEKYVLSLPKKEMTTAIQIFLNRHFQPKWIKLLGKERIQQILNLILREEEFPVTITPNMLNDLFLKLNKSNRKSFVSYLKIHITDSEKKVLLGSK
jgi:hypothetical protein